MEKSLQEIDSKIIQFAISKNKLGLLEANRFSSGVVNRVYNLGNKYALKIEGDGGVPGEPILKPAVELTEKLLAKGAKIPRILDYDTVEGTDYILMEMIPGNNLSYDWMSFPDILKEKLIAQLAEQLQIWHSIYFEKYCITIKSQKSFDNLQPAIERLSVKEINGIKKDKLPKEFLPSVEVLENFYHANIASLSETSTAVLVHQDIHLENIFCVGDKLTGIIDLDWTSQAPRDYELWKILDTFHAPKYTVEEKLEHLYEGYQMTKELNWLKKYYPALFTVPNLTNRIRLYYLDSLLETVIDWQNGRWSEKALTKVSDKVRDFYQTSWLDEILNIS
jgi:aminoglycoside phosphotransferase